ncbi:MAG: protein-(glutamine-N5) methyltransferase, release factor-specific, partial [Cyanobacteria bacterium P01_A01_bin.114]
AVARQNAERHQLTNRIEFRCGSWFDPLVDLKAQLAGLVSTPPYIPSAGVLALQPEVTCHEPHPALDGGADGLNDIRQLVQRAPDYLQTGALWLIETMAGQSQTVQELLRQQSSYCQPQSYSDLAGIQRFVGAERS